MAGLWLRLYTEIRRDRKLRRLPTGQRWLWIVLMTIAKESPRPGWLLLAEGVPVTLEDLVDEAAIPTEVVQAGIAAFIEQRMLEVVDGIYHLINWDKRNFASDNPTDRWRKWKNQQPSNVGQTFEQQPPNVGPTSPETDKQTNRLTDPETEKDLSLTTGQSPEAADKVSGKVLIAELTSAYRDIEGIKQSKGDHAFIGALYNEHGYQGVLSGINKLQMAAAVQEIEKPLIYLKGILQNKERDGGGKVRPPEQPKVVEINRKRREEIVRAACDFITLNHGPDPPRAQAEEIAREYGEDFVPDIMQNLFGGYP